MAEEDGIRMQPQGARSGGELLADCLIALGARAGFGVPGESYLALLDALHDRRGRLDYVLCRHEGGAAFMAAAWGKLTGSPGIAFVSRGPGAANAAIGVHGARQDSAPMILFVGQVARPTTGREGFQEIDVPAVFAGLAKWAVSIDRAGRIPELLSRAWIAATTGRPGPVVVALPEDMLAERTGMPPLPGPARIAEPAPEPAALAEALALLAQAARPVLLLGGGGWTPAGRRAMLDFATASDLPVLAALRRQDLIDNHAPVYAGDLGLGLTPGVRATLERADLVLAVNTRLGEISTEGYTLLAPPVPRQRLVHVHADAAEIGKTFRPVLGLVAGPNAFAAALSPVGGPWAGWRAEARAAFEAGFDLPPQPGPVDMGAVTAWLQDHLPGDAILTNGAGNFTAWPNKFFRFGPGQRLLAPQSGAMGYGLPAAIAARIACPGRPVVCFAGDGDLQMTLPELATAVQAGACPIVLVVNNGIYGTIRAHQERAYPGRVIGTAMVGPDFAALAAAYGIHGERVAETAAFPAAFARALASPAGAVLDLAVAEEAISPRATIAGLRAARA